MYFRGTKNTPCTTAVLVSYVATGSRQTNKCRYCCLCPFRTMSLLDFVGGTQASALETRGLSRRHMEAAESCERHLLFLKIKVRVFVRNTYTSCSGGSTCTHAFNPNQVLGIQTTLTPIVTHGCMHGLSPAVDRKLGPEHATIQTIEMLMVLPAPQGCKRVAKC